MYLWTSLPTQDHPNKNKPGDFGCWCVEISTGFNCPYSNTGTCLFNSLAPPPEPKGLHEKERQVENAGFEPTTYEGMVTN